MCAIHTNEKLLSINTSVKYHPAPICCRYSIQKKQNNVGVNIQAIHDKPCFYFLLLLFKCCAAGFSMLLLLQTCDIILWYIIYLVYCTHSTGCETTCKSANYFFFTDFFFSIQQIIDHLIFQFKF